MSVRLSTLAHTWLIDMDGVVASHNGYLNGGDKLLPGVREFWAAIPPGDRIVLLSARPADRQPATLAFMAAQRLRVDHALFGLPQGERILINDAKPSGLQTALALNVERDRGLAHLAIQLSPEL
jgi:hypothetical protein